MMNDADHCARIIRRHAHTFAMAGLLLPRSKRRAAFAVYAFCRTADDIVDLGADGQHADAARERLRAWREAYGAALRSPSPNPILRELVWAMERHHIPRETIETLLDGIARDLDTVAYTSWEALEKYCHDVASTVGEMCARVFGVAGGSEAESVALAHARVLGLAMQLTNILRDVGEDAARGRCYLPDDDLAQFSLSRHDILQGHVVRQPAAWRALMAFEVARARDLYARAVPGIALLSPDAQRCALACAAGYAGILGVIESRHYDTFTTRATLGRLARARLILGAWLGRVPDFIGSAPPPEQTPAASQAVA